MVSRQHGRPLLALEDYLLLAPVLLLPWAFGGVDIWAFRSAALLIAAAASVCLWKRGWGGWGLGSDSRWLVPAFLLAGWAALQVVPLPPAAIRLASPAAYDLYATALPGYGESGETDVLAELERQALERVPAAAAYTAPEDPGVAVPLVTPECLGDRWRTISVEPSATLERLFWYVALLLAFLVARDRVADRDRRRIYRWALFGMLGALALFAMVQLQFWNGKVYWVRRVLVLANPLGPYFNPTNLAGVMEIGVPGMVGLAWSRWRRHGRAAVYEPGFVVAVVAGTICLAAVVVSASKLAVLLVGVALFALGLSAARTWRARVAVVVVAVAVVAAGTLLIGGTRLGDRVELFLGRSQDVRMLEGRLVVWQSSGAMILDFPVTGAGFGTFREMFQRYLPAGAAKRWGHAHNDYLELLLDGGIVAALLVLWLIWGYGSRVAGRLRSRSGGLSVTRTGLAIGVACLAAHALVDFNHQIPANALVWVCCCALLLPIGSRTQEEQPA